MARNELTATTSRQLLGRLTVSQRIGLVAAFAITVVGLLAISRLGGNGPMALMFSDLDADSAATAVGELEARGVPYELTDGGRSIRVPADQVLGLRVELAANDMVAPSDGWSVLDDQGLTASEFDQRVGFQRALEGELARTISAIDGVNDADVHLVMPDRDLFTGDDVMPTASVLLRTGGSAVTSTQVRSIVNLVANSVEGLTASMVSVTDERGRLLASPETGVSGGGDLAMEQQAAFEQNLTSRLDQLLAAVAGPGNAVATVSAQLDFDSSNVTTETYEELEEDERQAVLTESTKSEIYRGDGAQLDAGILGPEDELIEGEEAGTNGVSYDLDEADVAFAVDKTITVIERAPGTIRALSVAVVLDEESIDTATATELESLVAAAVGFDQERGDTLALTVIPFDESFDPPAELAATDEEAAEEGGLAALLPLIRMGVIGLVAFLATVFTALFALRGRRGPQVVSLRPADLEGDNPNLEAIGAAAVAALGSGARDSEPTDLIALIESQPDDVAGMLRSWMADDRAGETV
ncbi:MAG: flagellar basal-body MS-ring/collar protein FliF [Acidimicrobiia bacterium]|nr:flagellar basal-body MS-ring/collar protein FliF [Acidimicrobiia bacterium]MDH5519624.1 flagellar basal-body MS-ring/collar protein FliF [Acidimicrobiia bacterium]